MTAGGPSETNPPASREIHARQSQLLETKFRGLLEAAPDAMLIMNADGRIVLVNAQTERLFGYTREELLLAPIEMLVPERFRERHPAFRTEYFRDPKPRPMGRGLDLSGRCKDGSEFQAEISLSPMKTDECVFATAAIRDVPSCASSGTRRASPWRSSGRGPTSRPGSRRSWTS